MDAFDFLVNRERVHNYARRHNYGCRICNIYHGCLINNMNTIIIHNGCLIYNISNKMIPTQAPVKIPPRGGGGVRVRNGRGRVGDRAELEGPRQRNFLQRSVDLCGARPPRAASWL